MKHLKLWENVLDEHRRIQEICKQLGIFNWTLRADGLVDVDGDCEISDIVSELPIKFGVINGNFDCGDNELTTLQGAPQIVRGNFYCRNNVLTNLEGGPRVVNGNFNCSFNKLTNLQYGPEVVGGYYKCSMNKLTTLQGVAAEVNGFSCYGNALQTLEGGPKLVNDYYDCSSNKLTTLRGAPDTLPSGYFQFLYNPITDFDGISRIIHKNIYWSNKNTTSLKGLPLSINGETSDKWLVRQIRAKTIKIGILHTVPDECITPFLLNYIRKISKKQYELIKARRTDEDKWKSDFTADIGDLGF